MIERSLCIFWKKKKCGNFAHNSLSVITVCKGAPLSRVFGKSVIDWSITLSEIKSEKCNWLVNYSLWRCPTLQGVWEKCNWLINLKWEIKIYRSPLSFSNNWLRRVFALLQIIIPLTRKNSFNWKHQLADNEDLSYLISKITATKVSFILSILKLEYTHK